MEVSATRAPALNASASSSSIDSSAVMTLDSALRGDIVCEPIFETAFFERAAREDGRAVTRNPTSSAISSPGKLIFGIDRHTRRRMRADGSRIRMGRRVEWFSHHHRGNRVLENELLLVIGF